MRRSLDVILAEIGRPGEMCSYPDGSRLLLHLHGARVLGLFAADSEENFYWTHSALSSSGSAAAFFRSSGWHNLGGERTWLAPEIDLFFPRYPDLTAYEPPAGLDPGKYRLERVEPSVRLVSRSELKLFRSRQTIHVEISKTWGPGVNPLRYEACWKQLAGVEFAGYTQRITLRLMGTHADEAGPVGTWSLVQLPPAGELFVPLHGETQPQVYFGTIAPGDLTVDNRSVRYKMGASGIQKIGIRAAAGTGRAGYMYSTRGRWALVVRNFSVNPSGEYVDVPWKSSGEVGDRAYVLQACNVNNDLGSFGELECHAPAIGRGTGCGKHEDVSQVWAFRGSKEMIQVIGRNLLAADF